MNAIYTHTRKYCFIIKKKEILLFATTWMDRKGLMQSEISQTEDDEYCRVSLICGIWRRKTHRNREQIDGFQGWGEMDIGQKYKFELQDEWTLEKRVWHGDYS